MASIEAVIFDYGCVISTRQVKEEVAKMEELAGANPEELWKTYWRYRSEYDCGLPGKEYWGKVLSFCRVSVDEALIEQLITHDIRSWTVLNRRMLVLIEKIKNSGLKLGLISNMPPDVLNYMKKNFTWLQNRLFNTMIFSCEIRLCKPNPAVFVKCIRDLGLTPEECLFVDDSKVNIQGARDVGLKTIHYTTYNKFLEEIAVVFNSSYVV